MRGALEKSTNPQSEAAFWGTDVPPQIITWRSRDVEYVFWGKSTGDGDEKQNIASSCPDSEEPSREGTRGIAMSVSTSWKKMSARRRQQEQQSIDDDSFDDHTNLGF